jgi:serine/threonine protein kinase
VHRDVRSPNVFIVSLNIRHGVVAKLGDYGLAAVVVSKLTESLNTFQWLAPEVLLGMQYDESVDVYSLAMVLLELIATKLPFCEFHQFFTRFTQWTTFYCGVCGEDEICRMTEACQGKQVEKLETGEKMVWKEQSIKDAIIRNNLRPSIPSFCPDPLAKLIRAGWTREASQRPRAQEMCAGLLEIMQEASDMSPGEGRLMKWRAETCERSFAEDVAALARSSFPARRKSSQTFLNEHKNPKILVGDPTLIEKASSSVTCMARAESAIVAGEEIGSLLFVLKKKMIRDGKRGFDCVAFVLRGRALRSFRSARGQGFFFFFFFFFS